jgi:hypothetical protein
VGGLTGRERHAGLHALGPPLQRGRAVAQGADDAVADRDVVLDDLELGDLRSVLGRRVDHPVGAGDPHLASVRVDDDRR